MMERPTRRRRLPTLSEVANTAALIASDRVSAMTGTVVNLSGGKSSLAELEAARVCGRPHGWVGDLQGTLRTSGMSLLQAVRVIAGADASSLDPLLTIEERRLTWPAH